MGSDLYCNVECRDRSGFGFHQLFDGPSTFLARGIIVDAFGDCNETSASGKLDGYLTSAEWRKMQEHEECPWRLDEPYWVRKLSGQEFCDIIRERRWKTLQDGDYYDLECGPELRSFAAMVKSLLADGMEVNIWCWHSQ